MSTSRKRSKASKGKKSNSSSSRSLAGDGGGGSNQSDMAGLQEPGGGGGAAGAGAGDDPWVWEKKKAAGVAKAKAPAGDRLVYFDPQIILPPADKRSAPGGETPEEQRRYNNRWMFTPATVLSAVDPEPGVVLIRTRDSAVHRANGAELETVNPQALEGVPDAMNVSNLTQASLLHTVRERYNRDEVYTRVGPVLMSVNPYKWIVGLYAEDAMLSYHGKAAMVEAGELAPHLFGVADHAYSELVKGHLEAESETKEDVRARKARASNQSIIISGESGSGKTEATKIIMQYLARITSGEAVGVSDAGEASDACRDSRAASEAIMLHVGDLESRVLSCNPLLESFGNAVTLKNDNSSRFGKFIKIQFDKKGRIRGAQIQNYLLEKTRIVAQAKRERSYHIFYQLLAGSSGALKKELKLDKGVAGFQCLKGSSIKGEDAPDFHHTTECLRKIGVQSVSADGEHGQDAIFRLIAAIMHLLNVGFESVHVNEGEACEIRDSTRPSLAFAAELLGVEADRLEKAAVSKTMAVRSSNTMMLQTVEQAHDKVAALGKALYSQLFLWLVAKLNTTISAPQSDVWGFIGVLDIYGFEKFNTNSLEQLLINYANEHLQRHFNQHMFEVEQVDYDNEQIDWSYITFNDNKACLELIDGKGGLFSCLDDIQRFEGKEANLKFLSSFKQKHGPPAGGGGGGGASLRGNMAKSGSTYGAISSPATRRNALGHPHFVSPRFDPDISFGIKHYAGDVFYNVAKFNQKNRENLTADMKDLMASSTSALVVDVFKAGEQDGQNDDDDDDEDAFEAPTRGRGGAGGRTIRSKSIGIQFKESLAELMATIAITHPRYIRCVKPNPDKQSGRFDGEDVLLQLQYSGTMETIRIRQQGYALRELKDDFLKKYKVLQPDAEDLEALVAYLSSMLGASHRDWQIGTSKVFLRTSMSDKLNLMVDLRKKCATRVIQRWAVNTRRRRVVRTTLQPFLKSSVKVMKYLRAAAYFRNLLEERRAATSMARWYRLSRDRKRFVSMRDAEKVVKSVLRVRYFVTQLGVRKEFAGSSVSEIEAAIEALLEKEKELKAKKDFLACLPIASRLHHLRIVATSMKERDERRKELAAGGGGGGAIGADGGPARQEVEVRLMEAGWRMADAEADQNYAVCTRLQREIKNLEAQREQNPTLAELKEKEEKTKAEIDKAAASADYARAGQLQTELVSMEEKIKVIEDVVEAEKARSALKDLSQKELEDKIHTTTDELEAAKAAKEFAKCIDLQARLSEMQAAAEAMPTMEQVEREVISAEAEMAAAKARKDYRRAAELSMKLPAILDRHSAVASAIRKAMNRKQLAEEVQRLEGEMRLAKAEKRFSQCSLLQRSLTEMQILTDGLPSVREIEEEISDVRVKMDTAVSEKNYADAEKYRVRLTELAEEKTLASEKEQTSNSSPQDPVAKARARLSASSRDLNFNSERAGLGAAAPGGGAVMDSRSSGSLSPPTPAPPADPSSGDRSFASPKTVKVKQAPAILSPARATPAAARVATARQAPASVTKTGDDVTVSKLRPKPAVTVPEGMSVTEVCKVMANARNDAALLTGAGGGMTGIVTAIDFIRRVVAVSVDPNSTPASEVMTRDPTTVLSEDSAMEALSIMLGRHFRHLPVRTPRGDVTGILDIAKCLYDAVSRLQRTAKRKSVDSGDANEAGMSMLAELGKGKGKMNKANAMALLVKLFANEPDGGTGVNLTLAELLSLEGEPQLVFADDSARGAGKAIARGRKAVLVVDNDGLAGIFTEKDMLNRVLSKGINPDEVSVEDVMTPNPDTVSSTMTVLEALQEMHENKYLHLPVVDEKSGNVLGVVSVMEIIRATAGEEGSTGWQALFGSGLDAAGDGFSDTSSQASMGSIGTRASARVGVGRGKTSPRVAMTPSAASSVRGKEPPKKTDSRPVSMLKPKPPLCLSSSVSVLEVAKKMADVRTDAAILLDNKGHLEGIISDQDVSRRVVANRLDPGSTTVSEVMTPHPTIVHMADSAMECLGIMIEKRFRHLPVIDGEGNVTGLLSIAKCLYDAIQRLKKKAARAENSGGGGNANLAASVLQMANAGKGKGKNKTRDLQAALAMLLANSSDEADANHSLREILSEQTTSFVDGRDSITAAASAIAKGRKAVLVLDQGRLAGILTPKDVLMRVVAKGLDPDHTPVSSIMTPNPDTVPPEMTAVEALGEMHENKYLHLPVVDLDEGTVVGVVNVMEILRATAGDKGSSSWEALFGSAMDAGDDVSDSASMYSMDRSVMSARQRGGPGVPRTAAPAAGSVAAAESVKHEDHHRPVSSLKPKPPLCLSVDLTVAQVAKRMAEIRTDAAILLGQMGDMKGVLTDHDVARKVVGRSLDPSRTPVASVMTPDPIWVTTTDNAMDALETMLETHSRHLPVVSEEGAVSGMLNIAKCLYDAIRRLEKRALRAEEEGGGGLSGEKQELAASLLKMHSMKGKGKGKGGKNTLAAMTMLLQGLSDGEEDPTLGDILSEQTGEFAEEGDSVAACGKAISRSKKAVLVLRNGRLAGIVTPKDLLMRVVAKGLDPDATPVSAVMTPNPDAVPPTMTVIEALREMHENKYLHLPVVSEDDGKVLGVVSVMEIIHATAGDKGSDRWEAFFGDAMDAADDVSDSASMFSAEEKMSMSMSMRSAKPGGAKPGAPAPPRSNKKVSCLKPKRPVVMSSDGSVLEVATEMSLKRTDAALLTKRGRVVGIVTDHDLTRRVIAFDKPPDRTPVRDIMTAEPAMVSMDESAMEALGLMIQNKTRHLPVMDAQGKIGGLLDIAKCLYDAVSRLEHAAKKKALEEGEGEGEVGSGSTVMIGAVMEAAKAMKGKASAKNQQALQELMMLAMTGSETEREGTNQTLADVLASKDKPEFVRPRHTVREAASVIASQKKAVLVVEEGELAGIFTPKDMMNRVITKKLNPGTTAVFSVMTPNPDGADPSMTVVEALQQMCENRYLHLPVVDERSGAVLGVVDVMEIVQATVGQEGSSGWEAFFGSAMDAADDMSDTMSETSLISKRSMHSTMRRAPGTPRGPGMGGAPPSTSGKRPGSMRGGGSARGGGDDAMSDTSRDMGGLLEGWDEKFVYKVNDDEGNLYKFKASAERLDRVLQAVSEKLKMPKDAILLKYQDDDGDDIVLSGDDSLLEAVDMARASSKPALVLVATLKLHTLDEHDDESHAEGSAAAAMSRALGAHSSATTIGIAAVAVVSVVAIFMSRGRK